MKNNNNLLISIIITNKLYSSITQIAYTCVSKSKWINKSCIQETFVTWNFDNLPSNNMMGLLSCSKKFEVASTQLTPSLWGCDRVARVLTLRARGGHVVVFTRPGRCSWSWRWRDIETNDLSAASNSDELCKYFLYIKLIIIFL